MKEIRLMAFDLDGTLLKSPGRLSEKAYTALSDLKKNKILTIINSGRPLYSVRRIIPDELIDYAVCQNGQMIWHQADNKSTEMPLLNREDRKKMLALLQKHHVILHCTNDEKSYYFCARNHPVFKYVYLTARRLASPLLKKHDYPLSLSSDPEVILDWDTGKICFAGFHGSLVKISSTLEDSYSCTFTNSHWLEVMHKGVSKGAALRKIIENENLSPGECAAFGDGENDLDMLEACGIRIAVANAMPELKKTANVFIGPNTEDAPACWIDDYLNGRVKL